MSAHLTLVVDNAETVPGASPEQLANNVSRAGGPAAGLASGLASGPPIQRPRSPWRSKRDLRGDGPDSRWVHTAWLPRRAAAPNIGAPTPPPARSLRPLDGDRGAVTAEYAIVIMAAVAFAGLLVAIMSSSEVRAMLVGLVQNALGSAG